MIYTFKPIRYLQGFSKYEMSQDGTVVRDIQTKQQVPFVQKDTSLKAELISDDGKVRKFFGIKTLYWNSWNKPLPSSTKPISTSEKLNKNLEKAEKKSKHLLSPYLKSQFKELLEKRKQHNGTALGQELVDLKSDVKIRVLLHNTENDILLTRAYSAGWQNGYWFVNTEGRYQQYDKAVHGRASSRELKWPDLSY